MGMTIIEKILAHHSVYDVVRPGEIVDMNIDLRVSRDLGGANVVKFIKENNLKIADVNKTFFTSDNYQFYNESLNSENQTLCRQFARENGIRLFDIHSGIGTHLMIDQGLAIPGITMVSNDSHVNILGAIGALGLGANEKNLISAFTKGKIWNRVPKSVKINLNGVMADNISAKDIALNLLSIFGSNKLLGFSVELTGTVIDLLGLDGRITLASMANELGAITFLMNPNQEVMDYCSYKSSRSFQIYLPDEDAEYEDILNIDVSKFTRLVAKPALNTEIFPPEKLKNKGIDSAFIGSCTNGRIEDLRVVAGILKGRKVAPGVILKIIPATDEIWTLSLQEGLIDIFKESGAIVADAGSGEFVSGPVSTENHGEVTISSGNKNFPGKASRGEVFIASPAIVAASAVAGFITTPELIPDKPLSLFSFPKHDIVQDSSESIKPSILEGKIWHIPYDNIDTDMIYHSRYTELTDLAEFGNYTFSDFRGFENFAKEAKPGDIIVVGKNFGLGNSTTHSVDCFKSLGIQAIVAKSFAMIYEKNAINAGLPVIMCDKIDNIGLQTGDNVKIDLKSGEITNLRTNKSVKGEKFSLNSASIYQNGKVPSS